MLKFKIVVLGPSKSGKTCISNFLSNSIEKFGGEYRPTQGVRILEFETNVNFNGKSVNSEIELWDCSGDFKFKQLWPVFLHKADGCIFIHDPSYINDVKELEMFYDYFLNVSDVDSKNCVVFSNNKSKNKRIGKKLTGKFLQIKQCIIDIEDDINKIKGHFDDFLVDLLKTIWKVEDQGEVMMD